MSQPRSTRGSGATFANTLLVWAICMLALPAAGQGGGDIDPVQHRDALGAALRAYFASERADGPELASVLELCPDDEDLLVQVLRTKAFVARSKAPVERYGRTFGGRFVDEADVTNPAMFFGPASHTGGDGAGAGETGAADELLPLVVYAPDTTQSEVYLEDLRQHGTARDRYVLLVTNNEEYILWRACPEQTRRHAGPLRDLLLTYAIDPDRVYMAGYGRGGHATWDIGLMRSERWAAIYPCNGGLIHEGGFALTGGVFVENARDLTVFTTYQTKYDHGVESCRHAASLLEAWGTRFERVEEHELRPLSLDEAMRKVEPVRRRAHPKMITKRFNRLADGSHYWLQALRRNREWDPTSPIRLRQKLPDDAKELRKLVWKHVQGQCARMRGTIAGNTILIEAQGVERIRVWFDPELVDFERKVTVTCNGKRSRATTPKRRVDVMLKQVHATGDTERLYWDYLDVPVRTKR